MEPSVKILFVDDEENILRSLKRLFLDEDEYEILSAPSGAAGLEVLEREGDVPLVVSDYRMPGMNGVEFLRQVHHRWPDSIRIVLSGYADTSAVVESINEGKIYKFIAKPWNDEELKVNIANAVESYRLNERNKALSRELQASNRELETINSRLEKLVVERTTALELRNTVLAQAQNLLDHMPLGVVGIDSEGLVVQCNREASQVLGEVFGHPRKDVLPQPLNALIEGANEEGFALSRVSLQGQPFCLQARVLPGPGSAGVVVVLIPECRSS